MTFPNVSDAFWGWADPVTLTIVTTTVADYQTSESQVGTTTFQGVLEPMPPQKLLIKPEGQRTWKWWYLWTPYVLNLGQIISDPDSNQYRVMQASDWRNGGHEQYELVQDPPLNA